MTGTTRGGRRSNAATAAIPTSDVIKATRARVMISFNVTPVVLVPAGGGRP